MVEGGASRFGAYKGGKSAYHKSRNYISKGIFKVLKNEGFSGEGDSKKPRRSSMYSSPAFKITKGGGRGGGTRAFSAPGS